MRLHLSPIGDAQEEVQRSNADFSAVGHARLVAVAQFNAQHLVRETKTVGFLDNL